MFGGNEEQFFHDYWRKRLLFLHSAVPEFRDFYSRTRFLEDYRRLNFHKASLLVSIDQQGNRRMSRPSDVSSLDCALSSGISLVLQALMLPAQLEQLPREWSTFLDLYHALSEYLLPGLPLRKQPGWAVAALDFFCTSTKTTIGGHYDTGDVFYFVLDGEKEWTVELTPDMNMGLKLASEGENYTLDRCPVNEHVTISLTPGDCIYVPPYTYHRVCSTGDSLAVSVGLPTFNELTILRFAIARMQKDRIPRCPLPSFPLTQPALYQQAQNEIKERSLRALESALSTSPGVLS